MEAQQNMFNINGLTKKQKESLQLQMKEIKRKETELKEVKVRKELLLDYHQKQLREIADLNRILLEPCKTENLTNTIMEESFHVTSGSRTIDFSGIDDSLVPLSSNIFDNTDTVLRDGFDAINQLSYANNSAASHSTSHLFNDTDKILRAGFDAINQPNIKQEPEPMEIPSDPIVMQIEPIDVDMEEDIEEKEFEKIIEELHEGFDWSDKAIVVTKFMDTLEGGVIKKAFKAKCPECNRAIIVCKKIKGNSVTFDASLYEAHIVSKHMF